MDASRILGPWESAPPYTGFGAKAIRRLSLNGHSVYVWFQGNAWFHQGCTSSDMEVRAYEGFPSLEEAKQSMDDLFLRLGWIILPQKQFDSLLLLR